MKKEDNFLSFNNYCVLNHTMKMKRKFFNLTEEFNAYKNVLMCNSNFLMCKEKINYFKWIFKE